MKREPYIIGETAYNHEGDIDYLYRTIDEISELELDAIKFHFLLNLDSYMHTSHHEYTLFTLVRRKTQFLNPLHIAGEIKRACPWYRYAGVPTLGKNGNRKVTGSINEMKRMTWGLYSPEQVNALEMYINNGIYSYLSTDKYDYGKPFQAVESYAKGKTPWL